MNCGGAGSLRGLRVALVLAQSTGGIGRHVASLARGLAARGAQVTVLGPPGSDELFGFRSRGADFVGADLPSTVSALLRSGRARTGIRSGLEARAVLREADMVHAHGLRAGFATALTLGSLRRGGRCVVTWHNPPPSSLQRGRAPRARLRTAVTGLVAAAALRVTARKADAVLAASADLVEVARSAGSANAVAVPVAAPPLPPSTREAGEVRAEVGAAGRPVVLAVGRLSPQKDYPTLLDATAHWRWREPVPLLVIAGEGPLHSEILHRIRAERLPVRLLGHREDVADLLRAADVVAVPSVWEARSFVAQEALRARCPLVATAVGGMADLVGDAGLLVPPHDPAALARAVTRVLDDPGLAAGLAAAGATRAATFPTEEKTVERVAEIYRGVLGR